MAYTPSGTGVVTDRVVCHHARSAGNDQVLLKTFVEVRVVVGHRR
jgi:hypothetical protein